MISLSLQSNVGQPWPEPATSPAGEAALVHATLGGNPRAFEQIVKLHHRRVFQFLYQMTRHRQDAEDLAQQTFIKAYRHLASFDPERPFISWLLTIARRNALNHFRSAKKWEAIPDDATGSEPSPASNTENRDQSENLWEWARTVLSARQFEVLWLRFAEELSTRETAKIVGLTETHVKVTVHRARQILLKGGEPT